MINRSISLFMLSFLFLSIITFSSEETRAQVPVCDIIIEKQASPADNTPFDFTVEGIGNNFERTLRDPSNSEFELFVSIRNGSATAVEDVPEGWILDEIECTGVDNVTIDDVPNGKEFTCNADNGTARCTFKNSLLPRNVPTLSQWGLIALASGIGIVSFIVVRRRKALA